jgi:rhodanese-related sulfurtransferase
MPLSDLSNPDILLRENWASHLSLGADGTPTLPPSFVAEVGPRVWLVDVREDGELLGPQGHIPGIWRLPFSRIGELARLLPAYTPVVLVCADGERSTTGARFLRALGMTTVAAMRGGMHAWRAEGFGVSRDESAIDNVLTSPAPGHGSDGRLLEPGAKRGRHLSREAIEEHLGDPAKVRRVKLAAILLASQTSCVDGREDRAIIGTPGGDAGELILGLAAVEQLSESTVDPGKVAALARSFADTFGGIYLHTDNHALNRLTRSLGADPRFEDRITNLKTIDDWEQFLRKPPSELRSPLLEHLVQPNHVGCGHLRLALTHPSAYAVRPQLISAFFTAFYTELWDGARDLHWVVLGGEHNEGAVVNVTVEDPLRPFSEVPMIAPSIGGTQMFVNHPQVVSYLREQTAHFLKTRASHLLPLSKSDSQKLAELISELGARQASATLTSLAAGLPTFSIHFSLSGATEVVEGPPIEAPEVGA